MKLVITGGSGSIGRALLRRLSAGDASVEQVVALTHTDAGAARMAGLHPGLVVVRHQGWHGPDVRSALRDADVLLHMAWSSVPGTAAQDPARDMEENVVQGLHLLDQAAQEGVRRVVFLSSGGTVYGRPQRSPIPEDHPLAPTTAYGISKCCFEHQLRLFTSRHGIPHLALRPGNVYGMSEAPDRPQGVLAHWMHALARGAPLELWDGGDAVRDLVHIDDMVEVLMRAMRYTGGRQAMNVGTGRGTSMLELLEAIAALAGSHPMVIHRQGPAGAVDRNVLDPALLSIELGYVPRITLKEGLSSMWAEIRQRKG